MKKPSEKKVSILTGNACNSNCVFCFGKANHGFLERSTREIAGEILRARGKFDEVEFTGGEFLIRKDALTLIRACRAAGFKSVLFGTNGTLLAKPDFASAVVAAGANKINFSLHGAKAQTHDAITRRPGSQALLLKGIDNVAAAGAEYVWITFVITKSNYREMPELARRLQKHPGVHRVVFTFVRPMEFFSDKDYAAIVPTLTEIVPWLRKAAKFSKSTFHYIPPCIFEKEKSPNAFAEAHVFKIARKGNPFLYKYLMEGMAFGKGCEKCARAESCAGVWKTYLAVYGDSELKPF